MKHQKNKYLIYINLLLFLLFLCGCNSQDEPYFSIDEIFQKPDSIFNLDSEYIAVIGDIQEYTVSEDMVEYLKETCKWLQSQNHYFNNIRCVLQNGDITWTNLDYQWTFADQAFAYLGSNLLLIPSTGNHDYTWYEAGEIKDRNSTKLNSLGCLGKLKEQNIQQFENGRLENIIVPVLLGNDSVYVISLEFGPRKEVISWAENIVRSNHNKKYILMTHEWMTREGQRIIKDSYAENQFRNSSYSTPEEIWVNMVYPNDNIICVLCGHNGFCKYLYSTNKAGREVCQILFNLQYQENGGDGMIQLWEFPKDKHVINISVYNTITRKFHSDPETSIKIKY